MKNMGEIKTAKGRKVQVMIPETAEERAYVKSLRDQGKIETRASSGDFERSRRAVGAKKK